MRGLMTALPTALCVPQNMTMLAGMQSLYLRVNVTNAAGLSMLSPAVTFRYKGPAIETVTALASGQTVSGAGLPLLPLFFAAGCVLVKWR